MQTVIQLNADVTDRHNSRSSQLRSSNVWNDCELKACVGFNWFNTAVYLFITTFNWHTCVRCWRISLSLLVQAFNPWHRHTQCAHHQNLALAMCDTQTITDNFGVLTVVKKLIAGPLAIQSCSKSITITLFTSMVPAARLSQIKSMPKLHFPY